MGKLAECHFWRRKEDDWCDNEPREIPACCAKALPRQIFNGWRGYPWHHPNYDRRSVCKGFSVGRTLGGVFPGGIPLCDRAACPCKALKDGHFAHCLSEENHIADAYCRSRHSFQLFRRTATKTRPYPVYVKLAGCGWLSANEKMTDKRSQETSGRMSSPETSEGISQHICKCSIAKGVAVPTLENRSQTPQQSPCSRGSQRSHWKGQVSRDICQGLDDNMGKDCDLKRSERHALLKSSANVQSSRWTCHPLFCDSCCSATNLSPPQTRDGAGMLACGPRCPCKALLPRTKSHAKGPAAEQIQSWQKARLQARKTRSQHRDLDVWDCATHSRPSSPGRRILRCPEAIHTRKKHKAPQRKEHKDCDQNPRMFDNDDVYLPSPRLITCAQHMDKLCVSRGCSPFYSCMNKGNVSSLQSMECGDVPCSRTSSHSSALSSNPVSQPCSRPISPPCPRSISPILAPCPRQISSPCHSRWTSPPHLNHVSSAHSKSNFPCSRSVSPPHSRPDSPHHSRWTSPPHSSHVSTGHSKSNFSHSRAVSPLHSRPRSPCPCSRPVSPRHSSPLPPSPCQRSISPPCSRPICTPCLSPCSNSFRRPISPCSRSISPTSPKSIVPRKSHSVSKIDANCHSSQDPSCSCKLYNPCRDCNCHRVWTTDHGHPVPCSNATLCRNCPCHKRKLCSSCWGRKYPNAKRQGSPKRRGINNPCKKTWDNRSMDDVELPSPTCKTSPCVFSPQPCSSPSQLGPSLSTTVNCDSHKEAPGIGNHVNLSRETCYQASPVATTSGSLSQQCLNCDCHKNAVGIFSNTNPNLSRETCYQASPVASTSGSMNWNPSSAPLVYGGSPPWPPLCCTLRCTDCTPSCVSSRTANPAVDQNHHFKGKCHNQAKPATLPSSLKLLKAGAKPPNSICNTPQHKGLTLSPMTPPHNCCCGMCEGTDTFVRIKMMCRTCCCVHSCCCGNCPCCNPYCSAFPKKHPHPYPIR
ncbi:unnamed protein product [Sphagnum jensenii]|uniref:Uncharacterized protein n=1 Tax=Sphagnum jensenii TaxID=128206 RepID=A0ABP1BLG4_9BRYO